MAKTILQDTANTTLLPEITVGGGNDDTAVAAVFTVHFCPPAPTAADGGAGTLAAGTYRYAATCVNGEGETPLGVASTGLTLAASHQASLTGVAVGPTGTTARKVYRSADAGVTWGLVGTISDNTTTTYTDNTASAGAAPPSSFQGYSRSVAFAGGGVDPKAVPTLLNALSQRSGRSGYYRLHHPDGR